LDRALQDFSQTLRLDAKHIQARSSRGFVYYLTDQPEKAIADFSEVIKQNPKAAVAYNNRGYNRQLIGKFPDALADYDAAIRLEPEYALAYQNKAWLLATCPEEKLRDGRTALAVANRACELRQWKEPSDLKALAAAHAELGEFDKAIRWQRKVVDAAKGDRRDEEWSILEKYQAQQPYRFAPGR
jgi:tetratricopeptide (TPR) repeat protein